MPVAGDGATADTVFAWPTTFADSLYTVSMTAVADSGTIALAALGQDVAGFTIGATIGGQRGRDLHGQHHRIPWFKEPGAVYLTTLTG